MKVSAQEEYGLRCLLQLARRQQAGNHRPLTLSEIARGEGLSVANVAKLIRGLRKAGLVASVLGRTGGYSLTRAADRISVAEALHALGGKLYDPDYCTKFAGDLKVCSHMGDCSIRSLWGVLEGLIERVLEKTMLSELIGSERGVAAALDDRAPAAMEGIRGCR
ncbi:MAG TPA: Rrf2 family transcriptional regulator [Candidatus Polarisedimenticolia bacterium]